MTAVPDRDTVRVNVDLHVHPSMKTFLANQAFDRRAVVDKGLNPFELRCNYPSLVAGGLDVICSAIYVPEPQLVTDCAVIGMGQHLFPRVRDSLAQPPFKVAVDMLQQLTSWVGIAGSRPGVRPIRVATTQGELAEVLDNGHIAVVHTVEGAHVLEGSLDNLTHLRQLGVAMLTLAHFYPNGVAPPVDAIPEDMFLRQLGCFTFERDLEAGLTPFGYEVVDAMLGMGMLIDLTHSTPTARGQILERVEQHTPQRPVLMSHVGYAQLHDDPMNPTREEARRIADVGGVIGVIFYNHWLTPQVEHDTLQYVVQTIKALVEDVGENAVGLGSDWDGMTDPPDDLKEPADWPRLVAALEKSGLSSTAIEKVLGGNALRVLEAGLP